MRKLLVLLIAAMPLLVGLHHPVRAAVVDDPVIEPSPVEESPAARGGDNVDETPPRATRSVDGVEEPDDSITAINPSMAWIAAHNAQCQRNAKGDRVCAYEQGHGLSRAVIIVLLIAGLVGILGLALTLLPPHR